MAPKGQPSSSTIDSSILKKKLFDEDDGSDSDGGAPVEVKVNEEFAKRFEHNKKREERQRLEEKYKRENASGSDSDSESSDETEDEDAYLATEALDAHISETLNALKSNDPRIYDKNAKFFPEEDETAQPKAKTEKPMRLKDYQRERLLAGGAGVSDSEGETEEPERPKTYVEEQAELKKNILDEINAAAGDASGDEDEDEDKDGGFLKRKEPKAPERLDENGVHPSRSAGPTITEEDVAKAEENPELFLSNFMAARAWAAPDGSNWQPFNSDDEDSDVDIADEYEKAYNMRFEDPEESNKFLTTYAREKASARSVRRENLTGRKRQRQLEKERKEQEKRERAEEKARLKKLKLEEAESRLEKVKRTAGISGKNLTDDQLLKLLDDDAWEDGKWEEEMKKRFGEDYYAEDDVDMHSSDSEEEGPSKKRKPKKPKWDDDIDIGDIVKDDQSAPQFTLSDLEDDDAQPADEEDDQDSRPAKKRKTSKDHKKERQLARKEAKQSRAKLEALVDANLKLETHPVILSTKKQKKRAAQPFRWRDTSPTSFGMTPRDILLAPSDKALNRFAGIKKYASYKDPDTKSHERSRLSKKGRLRKWRREVFGREYEKTGPQFGFEEVVGADEDGEKVVVEKAAEVGEKKRKRKRKRGHGKAEAEA